MTKRIPLVLGVLGVVAALSAVTLGVVSFVRADPPVRHVTSTAAPDADQPTVANNPYTPPPVAPGVQAAYEKAVSDWPLALPKGLAFPRTVTSVQVSEKDVVPLFVDSVFWCAWRDSYESGGAAAKRLALTNLSAWRALPFKDADTQVQRDLIAPATQGHDKELRGWFDYECTVSADGVATADMGIVIHKPALKPRTVAQLLDLCTSASPLAPCDSDYGPNYVRDLGSRTGARGPVTLDGAGVPASYTVVAGDREESIDARFPFINIDGLNCLRRSFTDVVYAGDVLNLDKYTIATVGSENGSTRADATTRRGCLDQSGIPKKQRDSAD